MRDDVSSQQIWTEEEGTRKATKRKAVKEDSERFLLALHREGLTRRTLRKNDFSEVFFYEVTEMYS